MTHPSRPIFFVLLAPLLLGAYLSQGVVGIVLAALLWLTCLTGIVVGYRWGREDGVEQMNEVAAEGYLTAERAKRIAESQWIDLREMAPYN